MCGFASGGINIVKFTLSPATWFTYSPIIGVVAKTLIFSAESLPDDSEGASSVVLHANNNIVNESNAVLNIYLKLILNLLIKFFENNSQSRILLYISFMSNSLCIMIIN